MQPLVREPDSSLEGGDAHAHRPQGIKHFDVYERLPKAWLRNMIYM